MKKLKWWNSPLTIFIQPLVTSFTIGFLYILYFEEWIREYSLRKLWEIAYYLQKSFKFHYKMYFKRLIPWSRLLEKPNISQLDNKYPAFYGNRIQYNLFLAQPLLASNLSQMNPIHAIPSLYLKSILISFHIRLLLQSGLCKFPQKTMYMSLLPIPVTRFAHL